MTIFNCEMQVPITSTLNLVCLWVFGSRGMYDDYEYIELAYSNKYRYEELMTYMENIQELGTLLGKYSRYATPKIWGRK